MAKTYQYCVAENWGKGFIEHDESHRITFKSYPGNVWQVPAYNKHANLWIAKVAGTVKTFISSSNDCYSRSRCSSRCLGCG
jgi:hypothetical protein